MMMSLEPRKKTKQKKKSKIPEKTFLCAFFISKENRKNVFKKREKNFVKKNTTTTCMTNDVGSRFPCHFVIGSMIRILDMALPPVKVGSNPHDR